MGHIIGDISFVEISLIHLNIISTVFNKVQKFIVLFKNSFLFVFRVLNREIGYLVMVQWVQGGIVVPFLQTHVLTISHSYIAFIYFNFKKIINNHNNMKLL